MFVVVWEPKHGLGGGHQLVTDPHRAEYIQRQIRRRYPGYEVYMLSAEEHSATVVRPQRGRA